MIWQDGFPVGNGFLGAMIWGDGAPLRFTLDCADLWDLRTDNSFLRNPDCTYATLRRLVEEKRYDEAKALFVRDSGKQKPLTPAKISIGRMELQVGQALEYTGRLDIDAPYESAMDRDGPRSRGLLSSTKPGMSCACDCRRRRTRRHAIPGRGLSKCEIESPGFCGARRVICACSSRPFPAALCYAVARRPRPDLFLAVECAAALRGRAKGCGNLKAAAQAGFDRLRAGRRWGWREFWTLQRYICRSRRWSSRGITGFTSIICAPAMLRIPHPWTHAGGLPPGRTHNDLAGRLGIPG